MRDPVGLGSIVLVLVYLISLIMFWLGFSWYVCFPINGRIGDFVSFSIHKFYINRLLYVNVCIIILALFFVGLVWVLIGSMVNVLIGWIVLYV